MWRTSDAYAATLEQSSRTWATRIDVTYADEIVTSLNVMISGYIGLDNVAVRREAHLTLTDVDGSLTPAQATDLLTPKGTELRIYRGLLVSGEYEWVPMGVFGIVEPQVRAHSEGTVIEIKGFDRVDKLRANEFEDPWVIADGTAIHTAIAAIVTARLPGTALRVTPSAYTTPALTFDRLTSPWAAIRELLIAGDYVCYFDQLGSCVVEPDVGVETGVVYEKSPTSVLMTTSRTFMSLEKTYSGVIARGEHPDHTPVRGEAWDLDPASPTYSNGPFGRRPYGVWSTLITTIPQAVAVATATLPRVSRIKQECEIHTRGTVAHDVGDIITVIDPASRTNGDYKIISGTIPIVNEQGAHVRLRCEEI
jgi:uncharacterized protein DUF5047